MTTPFGSADADVRRRRLLGTGLRADPASPADIARDVVLRRTDGGADLDVVSGLDALTQDLAVGLTTLRGSDPFNTRFGFLGLGPLTEATSPAIARETLRSAVAQMIAADPRVRRIVDITATPAGRALDITVTFEAISGDTATVAVGGLASGGTFGLETQP
jgi:phage baseplate assembly protein W